MRRLYKSLWPQRSAVRAAYVIVVVVIASASLLFFRSPRVVHGFSNGTKVKLISVTHGERLKVAYGSFSQRFLTKLLGRRFPDKWHGKNREWLGMYSSNNVGVMFRYSLPKRMPYPELMLVDGSSQEVPCVDKTTKFPPFGSNFTPKPGQVHAFVITEPEPFFGTNLQKTILWELPPSKEKNLHLRMYQARHATNSFDFWIRNPTRWIE